MKASRRHKSRLSISKAGRWSLLITTIALQYTSTFISHAQTTTADEYDIRAAMLFNLTKFIEWPATKFDGTHPVFYICVLGSDPLNVELDLLLPGKAVDGKPIVVRHLSSLDTANTCHVLYVAASQRNNVVRASAELAKNSVLTVSEKTNADNPEQVVGLPNVEDHVRIHINLSAAQRSSLTVSSRLLHLAMVTY